MQRKARMPRFGVHSNLTILCKSQNLRCLSINFMMCINSLTYHTQFRPVREFVREAGLGGKGNLPFEGTPVIVKAEPWDGKDGEIFEEDEFSLEELMSEDAPNKDEL